MIINIRLPHLHEWHVRLDSIDIYGADYFCSKCLKTSFSRWTTLSQIYRAEMYLALKKSAVLALKPDTGKGEA